MPTYTPNITQIQQVNSTTYADLLGLQVGLDRLQGESAETYLKRLEFAVALTRKHPYEGALNEINLQLGLEPMTYINVAIPANTTITISIAGVVIPEQNTIPLLTFDNDSMWKWRLLSEVVADINNIYSATLLVADGPAMQLARQSNSLWSFNEEVDGVQTQLAHSGIQLNSVVFNQTVPSYTLTQDGLLTFSVEPDSGTLITYNYIVSPYQIVGAPVAMIGLTDPEFQQVAETDNSTIAYQVREFIQSLMLVDRSYWAK